jgi:2-polyprenyl-3-methyl-5-hydroxy-6-metoxy-1,4-benzoquinol methylase
LNASDQLVIAENTSKNTHNVVAELLGEDPGHKVILDLPCGEGAFSKRMREKGADIFSADCLNIIKIPNPQFSLVDMNGRLLT